MKNVDAAKQYTSAFFELAEARHAEELTLRELEILNDVFRKEPKIISFFKNPLISDPEKIEMVERLSSGSDSDLLKHFLLLLNRKNRMEFLPLITQRFRRLLNDKKGTYTAHIVSARKLPEPLLDQIRHVLEVKTKKKIKCELHEDPSLLGGLQVRIRNYLIDASLRTKLNELRIQLATLKVI